MSKDLKAQLEISADVDGVDAGVSKAKRSIASLGPAAAAAGKEASKGLSGLGDGAPAAAAKVEAATKNLIGSIQRQIASLEAGSKSGAEYYRVLASQRGIDATVLRPYLDQLDAVTRKTRAANDATVDFTKTSASARQTAAALRGVPAQLTDIVTSLQAGQAPITVLLQQGGQLKDMFGGIAPAARALGGAVLGLVNPFTVAAGAVALLVAAYNSGSKEADAFAKAIIMTGNASGATVGQYQAMAEAIDGVVGTQAQAADAIAQFVATGRVAASSIEQFATVAIRLERVAGKAVADTVKEFAELGKDPVEASRKLNDQYGYLTLSVYEQIKALQDQGRATEAAALAQRTFADEMANRADRLTERLGYIERAWRGIKDAAAESWDAMLNAGRASAPESQLQALQDKLAQRVARGPLNESTGAAFERGNQALRDQIDLLQSTVREQRRFATAEAERAASAKAGIAAEQEISRIRAASATNQEKLNAELKKYRDNLDAIRRANPSSELLDPARIARDEANIRERFKTKAPAAKAFQDDAATRMLQRLREAESVSRAQLDTADKLTAAEKERAEFVQLMADLKGKAVLTAEQKSLVAAQEAIKAQLDRNVAIEKEVAARADATKEMEKQRKEQERFAERAAQLGQSIAAANQQRGEQFDQRLQVFGRGSEAREQLQAQIAIQAEFRRYREQLDKATPTSMLGSDAHAAEVERIKAGLADALRANEDYFAAVQSLQGDTARGASQAFEDYIAGARNVAASTEGAFNRAFSGMEDALVQFARTGKLSFSDLASSIIADLIRIQARASVSQFLQFIGPMMGFGSQLPWGNGPVPAVPMATGTNYVPYDGFRATLHKGEAVVPAKYNPAAGGGARVTVNNYAGNDTKVDVREREDGSLQVDLRREAVAAVAEDTRRGGVTARAMAGRFGVNNGATLNRRRG